MDTQTNTTTTKKIAGLKENQITYQKALAKVHKHLTNALPWASAGLCPEPLPLNKDTLEAKAVISFNATKQFAEAQANSLKAYWVGQQLDDMADGISDVFDALYACYDGLDQLLATVAELQQLTALGGHHIDTGHFKGLLQGVNDGLESFVAQHLMARNEGLGHWQQLCVRVVAETKKAVADAEKLLADLAAGLKYKEEHQAALRQEGVAHTLLNHGYYLSAQLDAFRKSVGELMCAWTLIEGYLGKLVCLCSSLRGNVQVVLENSMPQAAVQRLGSPMWVSPSQSVA